MMEDLEPRGISIDDAQLEIYARVENIVLRVQIPQQGRSKTKNTNLLTAIYDLFEQLSLSIYLRTHHIEAAVETQYSIHSLWRRFGGIPEVPPARNLQKGLTPPHCLRKR